MNVIQIDDEKFQAACRQQLRQYQIAGALGINQSGVSSRLKAPGRMPTNDFLAICSLLECDPKIFYQTKEV